MAGQITSAPARPITTPTELVVCLNPYNLDYCEYFGTRAMLEAEGILPENINWPEGFDGNRWDDGRFKYWLRRVRPEGIKGPKKAFLGPEAEGTGGHAPPAESGRHAGELRRREAVLGCPQRRQIPGVQGPCPRSGATSPRSETSERYSDSGGVTMDTQPPSGALE